MGRPHLAGRLRTGPYERQQLTTLGALAAHFHTPIGDLEDRPMWQILDLIELAKRQNQG